MPMDKVKSGIKQILEKENEAESKFKQAILTTDTAPKILACKLK